MAQAAFVALEGLAVRGVMVTLEVASTCSIYSLLLLLACQHWLLIESRDQHITNFRVAGENTSLRLIILKLNHST